MLGETPQQTYDRHQQEQAWYDWQEDKKKADEHWAEAWRRGAVASQAEPPRVGLTASGQGKPRREHSSLKWVLIFVFGSLGVDFIVKGFF